MNVIRSATAPEIMVTAVPQNIAWKMKNVESQGFSVPTFTKNRSVPRKPLCELPNMSPKPTAQKSRTDSPKSVMFSKLH